MTDPVPTGQARPAAHPPVDMVEYRRRQRDRSRVTGLALLALAVLIFFVTIAKMELGG